MEAKKTTGLTASASRDWFQWLCDHCIGSSGHGGNLSGMRRLHWGKDACVIRCCGYLFYVTRETFSRVVYGD